MPLTVDIVTAERSVLSEEGVDEVVVPGIEGELTVLPQHAPLLTMIKPGLMRLKKGADETEFAVTGGFLEVRDDKVTILADAAERAEEIDIARAEEAKQRAERLLEQHETDVDLARVSAELQRSLIRLKVAERRRRRTGTRPGPPGV
jgi:F-type H+-transporting ATPase subunit epsilon